MAASRLPHAVERLPGAVELTRVQPGSTTVSIPATQLGMSWSMSKHGSRSLTSGTKRGSSPNAASADASRWRRSARSRSPPRGRSAPALEPRKRLPDQIVPTLGSRERKQDEPRAERPRGDIPALAEIDRAEPGLDRFVPPAGRKCASARM